MGEGSWARACVAAVLVCGCASTVRADALAEAAAKVEAEEYAISWQPEGYQAPNRAHGFRTWFTEAGIRAVPRVATGPSWEWGLTWIGYGGGPVPGADHAPRGSRMEYRRGPHTEWYENGPLGLEQGFLLAAPPPGEAGQVHLDLALTGTLSPLVAGDGQSIDFVDGTGARVLRYAELHVTDALGRTVPASMEALNEDGVGLVRLVLEAGDAVYPITVDPLTTSPVWTAESDQSTAEFGKSVGTAGDINGDGYSDLIVGAPFYDNGQTDEGRAYLYLGSPSGLATLPAWIVESDQASARFGWSVGTAGDVNGDGYADVIVGAPRYDNGQTDEGRAFVYLGSAGGLSTTADWTKESDQGSAQYATSVGTAGDVNGDGFSDVIVGAPLFDNGQTDEGRAFVYLGSAGGPAASAAWTAESDQAGAQLGTFVATAGDVTGDGFAEVIVGSPLFDNGQTDEGRAYLYAGTASGVSPTALWVKESDQAGAQFGFSVGTAGDIDGDGYTDVLVGAWLYDNGQTDEGRAFLYLGSPGGPGLSAWTGESNVASADYGWSVGTAGDVNGDGYADFVVSAPFWFVDATTGGGEAFVYLGSPSGLPSPAVWSVQRSLANAAYGWSVATAGDVNGDAYADVVVGAPWDDNPTTNEGIAYVYHGGAEAPATVATLREPNQAAAHLGEAVAFAGDVNGDGYADVVAGAPGYDTGVPNAGKAYLFLGSPTGITPTTWSPEGAQQDGGMGAAVASAGDVNGDGYGDVLVGTPTWDAPQGEDAGKAELYLGSPTGLAATPAWTKEGAGLQFLLGTSLGTAGDINADGFGDVIVGVPHDSQGMAGGQALVFLGSASGLPAMQDWALGSGQPDALGYSVGTAGDVNRDGYADVVVGAPAFDSGQVDEGRAFLFLGGPSGPAGSAQWTIESNATAAFLGQSIAAAGDVNGDGYGDVIVGVPGGADGSARIYLGSATGLSTSPARTLLGSAWGGGFNSNFGASVASAGDVNGDGFADVIIGSPFHQINGPVDIVGHAFVALGSAAGVSSSFVFDGTDAQSSASYGWSVSGGGDLDGDGYADIAVGSPENTHGEIQEGAVLLYKGNSRLLAGGLSLHPRQRRGGDSAPIARLGVSGAPDLFRLAAVGRTPFGRGKVKLEWEAKRLGVALTGTPSGATPSMTDTGVSGTEISTQATGLLPSAPYHWRVRLRYDPASVPFAPASRWFTVPWGGRNEAMLRMSPTAAGAGDVTGLMMSRVGAQVALTWAPSCTGTDWDYAVYEGALGSFGSHVPLVCSTSGNLSVQLTPGAGSRYYLVVPHNATSEGSYGRGQANAQRPASASACRAQQVAACP